MESQMIPAEGEWSWNESMPALDSLELKKDFQVKKRPKNGESRQFNTHPGGPKAKGPFYGYSHYYDKRR